MTAPIWLLGCGNMGGALLRRWLTEDMGPVAVIDPSPAALPEGVTALPVPPAGRPDLIVLAVKPQVWREAAAPLAAIAGPLTLIVSVMAGVPIADIASVFPASRIIRAMPNTPVRHRAGGDGAVHHGGRPGRRRGRSACSARPARPSG